MYGVRKPPKSFETLIPNVSFDGFQSLGKLTMKMACHKSLEMPRLMVVVASMKRDNLDLILEERLLP